MHNLNWTDAALHFAGGFALGYWGMTAFWRLAWRIMEWRGLRAMRRNWERRLRQELRARGL